jgi:hypothetical protein
MKKKVSIKLISVIILVVAIVAGIIIHASNSVKDSVERKTELQTRNYMSGVDEVEDQGEGEDEEEPAGDDKGHTGRVKRIQTGPTEVEYFDELSDSLSTLYKAYSEALKPNGIMEILRQNICNLASRLIIFLPICDNGYKPVKVPRVVNRRHPRGIDGPNPPTILSHR